MVNIFFYQYDILHKVTQTSNCFLKENQDHPIRFYFLKETIEISFFRNKQWLHALFLVRWYALKNLCFHVSCQVNFFSMMRPGNVTCKVCLHYSSDIENISLSVSYIHTVLRGIVLISLLFLLYTSYEDGFWLPFSWKTSKKRKKSLNLSFLISKTVNESINQSI